MSDKLYWNGHTYERVPGPATPSPVGKVPAGSTVISGPGIWKDGHTYVNHAPPTPTPQTSWVNKVPEPK